MHATPWARCSLVIVVIGWLLFVVHPRRGVAQEAWGDLRGRILVVGEAPEPARLEANKDIAVCGRVPLFDESLMVGANGGLKNVVVMMLRSSTVKQAPPVHPDYLSPDDLREPVRVVLRDCRLKPRITFAVTGQSFEFHSEDEVGHHVSAWLNGNPFQPDIPPGQDQVLETREPENTPVLVVCSAHPWMTGRVLVRDEPYVAISGETGEFEIKNLPEGEWTFVFWHERGGRDKMGGYLMSLRQGCEKVGGCLGEIRVTIKDGEVTDLGTMTIAVEDLVP